MRILQISQTHEEPCGIGTYSRSLERALLELGIEVVTASDLVPTSGHDVVLIQHEWGLFADADLLRYCGQSTVPVVMFAHAGGIEIFSEVVDGVVAMHRDIVGSVPRPSLVIPPPAWLPHRLWDRRSLLGRAGSTDTSFVVGSSGFLTGFRQFPAIVEGLLPVVAAGGGFIDLVTARVGGRWFSDPGIEAGLDALASEHPAHFRYGTRYLETEELNLRLRACDLLWCYTNRASSAYGSGAASDQYASGTAMVLSDVQQHRYILDQPGATAGPADLGGFIDTVAEAIETRRFERHQPTTLSWPDAARRIVDFVSMELVPLGSR